ncbi:MAG: carboxypeptidase regulatory-like domain-containing protein, partial [Dehalococcoidia bacterium]
VDTDNDGTPDCLDGCPSDPGKTAPGVCGCGTPDVDSDNDGTLNCNDGCPYDSNKTSPGACGCGVADTDTDGDGNPDCNDLCPFDPNKTAPGACGCGVADTDSDNDGTPDCTDNCDNDPLKTEPGVCGCGVADTDTDSDGTPDCNDGCPSDPVKVAPGQCGCGVMDIDSDGDGTPNCNDGCPLDPLKVAPGVSGCGVADTDDGIPDCSDLGPPARTLPDQVLPGERFQVKVTFTAPYDGFHAIALTDVAPAGWEVNVNVAWADPEATAVHTPAAETAAYVWYGPYDVCVPFTAVYEVRVPVNTEPGTYTFSGSLEYYIEPHPAPPDEQEVTGVIEVRVKEGETVNIEGVTKEVDCAILPGAAVVLYQDGEAIGNVMSDESGNYEFEFSELGDYEVVVSKAGFRGEAQSISVTTLATYYVHFVGDHGLIPDAPSMSYVLACISLWKFGEPPLELSTSRILDVISAWIYPIT